MTIIQKRLAIILAVLLMGACSGAPVSLGTRVSGPIPTGQERVITAEACGFQLLLFIPIAVNGRMESAYRSLQEQAAGDFITDVQVQERWTYALVGTIYCTGLRAKAVHSLEQTKQSSELPTAITSTPLNESLSQKLRELESLRKDKVITEDEYQKKRKLLIEKF